MTSGRRVGMLWAQRCSRPSTLSRSPRGRLTTHAFYFDVGNVRLPDIKGADAEQDAKWVALHDLSQLEDQLFEDHAAILEWFVGVYR